MLENTSKVISGVDRKADSVIEMRREVQSITIDAFGNLSDDEIRKNNLNIYGKSFMIFKNWILRLLDVRLVNLKYEWGKK